MEGVTTAIVFFIFTCVVIPSLVKHRPQFYAAIGLLLLIILLDALGHMFLTSTPKAGDNASGSFSGFHVFVYFACAILQVGAIVMLFTSCGGISPKQFGSEMLNAIEVIRRGESEKEIIVPLSGQKATRPAAAAGSRDEPEVFKIDDEEGDVSLRKSIPPRGEPPRDSAPIPLDNPPRDPPQA
jgi:hypothetical protein